MSWCLYRMSFNFPQGTYVRNLQEGSGPTFSVPKWITFPAYEALPHNSAWQCRNYHISHVKMSNVIGVFRMGVAVNEPPLLPLYIFYQPLNYHKNRLAYRRTTGDGHKCSSILRIDLGPHSTISRDSTALWQWRFLPRTSIASSHKCDKTK